MFSSHLLTVTASQFAALQSSGLALSHNFLISLSLMNKLVSSANSKNDYNKFELSEYDSPTQETGAKTIERLIFAASTKKKKQHTNGRDFGEVGSRSSEIRRVTFHLIFAHS